MIHHEQLEAALRQVIVAAPSFSESCRSETEEFLRAGEYGLAASTLLFGARMLPETEWNKVSDQLDRCVQLMADESELRQLLTDEFHRRSRQDNL